MIENKRKNHNYYYVFVHTMLFMSLNPVPVWSYTNYTRYQGTYWVLWYYFLISSETSSAGSIFMYQCLRRLGYAIVLQHTWYGTSYQVRLCEDDATVHRLEQNGLLGMSPSRSFLFFSIQTRSAVSAVPAGVKREAEKATHYVRRRLLISH